MGPEGLITHVWGRSKAGKLKTGVRAGPNPVFWRKGWAGDALGRRRRKVFASKN